MSAADVARALVDGAVAPDAAVGWAVRREGGWVRGAGRASRDGGDVGDPIFDLASLTKPMLAVALARSPLSRTAAVGDHLPAVAGTPSASVSLELLLAHRAGLEAHVPLYEPAVRGLPVDRDAALRVAARARRSDAPGDPPAEGFEPLYSDLGYILAGEALARASRARDAGEVIETHVAGPLGERDALGTARSLAARSIDFAGRVRPTEVVPLRGGEVRGVVHDENAWALTGTGGSGHAGLFGTVAAVLAFGCGVLDALDGVPGPLDGGDLAWLVRPRAGESPLRAGFDGKSERASSAGTVCGPRTFGHLGFTGTSLWIDPDAAAVVVVLTNRVHPSRENVAIRQARPAAHDALFALARRHTQR